MSIRITQDLFTLGADLMRLLKAREVEAAIELVNKKKERDSQKIFKAAVHAVSTLNKAIKATQREKSLIMREIGKLPPAYRLHAEMDLKPLIDHIFSDEITRLRAEKRRMSHS